MKNRTWEKNLLFLSLVIGGVSLLTIYLMAADRIKDPKSYSPPSQRQKNINAVVVRVDRAFENQWAFADIKPTREISNLAIARRLALGLAGTIPSVEEIREFERQPVEYQVHWWVSRLLEDRRTSNHLAERFGRALVGVENGPFLIFRRRRFVSWLSDQLHQNRPYNEIVRQILTDEGLWTDTPAVNFYTRNIAQDEDSRPDPVLLAGRTSRAFLGMRIDCLQCHDDFMGTINLGSENQLTGGTQYDFHALAAFFSEVENSLLGIRDQPESGPYEYQLLGHDKEEAISASVPFNEGLDSKEENLRVRLAKWVTHPANMPFARAVVNRAWANMFGRGLIQPVDDIPLAGPFPEALEILANDFVENGFDLHRLIRVIASTKLMKLDSAADFDVTRAHENALAVFPLTRLRPEQVSGAIIQSTKLTTIDSTSHIITRLTKFEQQREFVARFGDPGEDEFKDRGETVTQRLLMLNGSMIDDRLNNPLNAPLHLAALSPSLETAVNTVYLSTLTRRATEKEKQKFVKVAEAKQGQQRTEEVVDLYWSLLNSAEFRWNH